MEEQKDKAKLIRENIEATIGNAMDTAQALYNTADPKKQRELLDKNGRRSQAVSSMIKDMKEEEARQELERE